MFFLSKFLGLVTYLDWIMIIVTIVSAVSMSFETPSNRVVDQPLLQVKIFIRQKKNIEILIFISIRLPNMHLLFV